MRPGWRSPYAPAPRCQHAYAVEVPLEPQTVPWDDPAYEIVRLREFVCVKCGTEVCSFDYAADRTSGKLVKI